MSEIITQVRTILSQQGRLSVGVDTLDDGSDLHEAGLTSLATVGVMLALEDHFNIEFRETMLSRKTFANLESIAEAVDELVEPAQTLSVGS